MSYALFCMILKIQELREGKMKTLAENARGVRLSAKKGAPRLA